MDNKYAYRIYYLLMLLIIIGAISTWNSRISPSIVVSLYDVLIFVKPYIMFMLFFLIPDINKEEIVLKIRGIATIIFYFTVAVFFVYAFTKKSLLGESIAVFNNFAQMSWLRLVTFNILIATGSRAQNRNHIILFYLSLIIVGISGFSSALFAALTIYLYLYRKNKERKLRIWQLGVLGIIAFVFAYNDLAAYIFNPYAPRAVLLRYGAVTANHYFPLGSGFASYGSAMARDYYSQLYYDYGFNNVWSMSYASTLEGSICCTLSDGYFCMIIGQFGWIGLLLFAIILFSIYKIILNNCGKSKSKAVLLATLITIVSTMFVSANTTSYFGICLYAIMGLLAFKGKKC